MGEVFDGENLCRFEYDGDGMREMITVKDAEGNIAFIDPQDLADFIEHNIVYEKGSLLKLIGEKPDSIIDCIKVRFKGKVKETEHGEAK